MIRANDALSSVLAKCDDSDPLSAAILAYFGRGSKEGESLDALRSIMEAAAETGDHYDELDAALKFSSDEVGIGALVSDSAWFDWLDQSVHDMPAHTNCGADCFSLIMRADRLLADMADVDDEMQSAIYEGVAKQCSVFVNG